MQGQVELTSEQPHLIQDVPTSCTDTKLDAFKRSLSTQTVLRVETGNASDEELYMVVVITLQQKHN